MATAQAAGESASGRWAYGAFGQALCITVLFALLRLLICPLVGLGTNEAYAIAGGRLLSLSYFDHPPLHFWLAHLCEVVFGDTRKARIPFIVLGAATSWLMFRLARQLFGERAGVWATLVLNLSIFFSLVSGNWILPDGPLDFFLLATALVLAPLAKGGTLSLPSWLLAGLLLGLAALSKYHAFVFALSFFAYLLASSRGRDLLRTPRPWLAALVALLVFSPVLIWNHAHDWASFRFQGGRAGVAHHLGVGTFLSLAAAQLALLSPWVVWPLARSLARARGHADEPTRFLLWLGLPTALFFSLVPLWSDGGMVQWAMPGWLMLLPLAGNYLADRAVDTPWSRRWALSSAAIFLLFVTLVCAEMQTGWLGQQFPRLFRKGDPTAEMVEWWPLAGIRDLGDAAGTRNTFVLTFNWRDAAKIDQVLGDQMPVVVASDDPRDFAFAADAASLQDRTALIVSRSARFRSALRQVGRCFAEIQPLRQIAIRRGGSAVADLIVARGTSYRPSQCAKR
jgi:hypothetical protein